MPVHVGVPAGMTRVDVQVIVPRGGRRVPVWRRGVDPMALQATPLEIRAPR